MSAVVTNADLKAIYDDASTKDEVKSAIENAVKNDEGHENDANQERLAVFLKASKDVTELSKAPLNDVKLELYALYKQGLGCEFDKNNAPGVFEFAARAKHNAWQKVVAEGITPDTAQTKYTNLVRKLQAEDTN